MWNEKTTKQFLIIYLSFLLLATFFIIPTITSFYYYAWGKQLAWSYFDGPPMIAFFFHVSHALFGNTFFSINIIGFLCTLLGAFYVYKIGCLLDNQRTGIISALIWTALPTTTESIFIRVLYDTPLNLFTIMSFYYFARYIDSKRFFNFYVSALCIGFMLLSKYTAGVSVLCLLVYVICSKQRELFKSVHFYLAILLILFMVSPVLYWNIQHQWVSITYLLNFHSQGQNHATLTHCLIQFFTALLVNYSVFLFLSAAGWQKYRSTPKNAPNFILELVYSVLFVGLIFWFVAILFGGDTRAIYLAPLGLNIALASGYAITNYQFEHYFKFCYPLFLLVSIVMILANSWPIANYLKKGIAYTVIQEAIKQPNLITKDRPIVAGYYTNAAAMNFFLPDETIDALPCEDINQYLYWSNSFLTQLAQGKIEKIAYIDFKETKVCAEKYFQQCQPIITLSHRKTLPLFHKQTKPVSLYVYECSLPKAKEYSSTKRTLS